MTKHMKDTRLVFSSGGHFTTEIREEFSEKIASLGLEPVEACRLFRVSPLTLKKWLNGTIDCCSVSEWNKIIHFLSGDYDRELSLSTRGYVLSNTGVLLRETRDSVSLPDSLLCCMERISTRYERYAKNNKLSEQFIKRLDRVLAELDNTCDL